MESTHHQQMLLQKLREKIVLLIEEVREGSRVAVSAGAHTKPSAVVGKLFEVREDIDEIIAAGGSAVVERPARSRRRFASARVLDDDILVNALMAEDTTRKSQQESRRDSLKSIRSTVHDVRHDKKKAPKLLKIQTAPATMTPVTNLQNSRRRAGGRFAASQAKMNHKKGEGTTLHGRPSSSTRHLRESLTSDVKLHSQKLKQVNAESSIEFGSIQLLAYAKERYRRNKPLTKLLTHRGLRCYIKRPLHKILHGDSRVASIFRDITGYMGDRKSAKSKTELVAHLLGEVHESSYGDCLRGDAGRNGCSCAHSR